MGLQIMIDSLTRVSDGVWEAKLNERELGCLNKPALKEGTVSVMIVRNPVVSDDGRLGFSADQAPVINLGNSDRVVIVADGLHPSSETIATDDIAEAATSDRGEGAGASDGASDGASADEDANGAPSEAESRPGAVSWIPGMQTEEQYKNLVKRHLSRLRRFEDDPVDLSQLEAG